MQYICKPRVHACVQETVTVPIVKRFFKRKQQMYEVLTNIHVYHRQRYTRADISLALPRQLSHLAKLLKGATTNEELVSGC